MATTNFVQQTIQQQLAQRSGQVSVAQRDGGYQFVDELTGRTLTGRPASSSMLANPQRPNDPKIKAQAVNLAKGAMGKPDVPPELVEAIASVAAYESAVTGTSVSSLFPNNNVGLRLIGAYNAFKPKGSQIGMMTENTSPAWANNPTLRGNISAAITDQP